MKVGIIGLLGLLFIGLKLGAVIDWNWIWVLAPFWVGIAMFGAIALFVLIVAVVAAAASK